MERIINAVKIIKDNGFYPDTPVISSPHRPEVTINGKKVFLFASNNYLGMLTDERVINAAIEGAKKWGIGNGSARLLTGNLEIHFELEKEIADFKRRESALTFVAGCMVNEGCIPAIVNVLDVSLLKSLVNFKLIGKPKPDTIIFSDEYNHASAIIGIKLSNSPKEIYNHNDIDDLHNKLKKYSIKTRKLIVTDGVFSMDGDIVKLPEIVELAKKYNAMIYLDDAHATGILGENGRGVEEYFNMEGSVDFVMGTFTKAFGGVGGFIASKKDIIDYLKITAKSFIFTAPIAPPIVYGLIEAVKIVRKESWRRENLLRNAEYFRNELKNMGFDTMTSQTQIIPVLIGNEGKAKESSRFLLENNIFVPAATWPAVPKGMARLRFALMSSHTKEQIDYLLEVMKKLKEQKF